MQVRSIEGQFVDVVEGKIYPSRVSFADGKILAIEKIEIAPSHYILPGLVDGHIHIESSQLCPSRFAEAAIVHGTTAVVCDPHEIANVRGMDGIRYMMEDCRQVPLRIYFTAPSSVPSSPYETSGSRLDLPEVERLLQLKEVVALGEVMDYPAVLHDDPGILAKIKAAKMHWKPIDGHCPGMTGQDLVKYINAGITTDHECLSSDEAEEKLHLGMWVMVQEGSANRNLRPLLSFAKANECIMVSDDLQAVDLLQGHLDVLLRKAVAMGVDPIHAIRTVTAWPSWHYYLPGGTLAPGKAADLIIVKDLKEFQVLQVYIAGELVAENGKALFHPKPLLLDRHLEAWNVSGHELLLDHPGENAKVRVIRPYPNHIQSKAEEAMLRVCGGKILPDSQQDVLLLAVLNRYHQSPPALGFISGFGLTRGAMASTVAHDAHHIIGIGADANILARALNEVSRLGGYFVDDGERHEYLELDIAGLMSSANVHKVAEQEQVILTMLRNMGCHLPAPFMTLAFQSLLVVPELKISDRGLFDSLHHKPISPIIQ